MLCTNASGECFANVPWTWVNYFANVFVKGQNYLDFNQSK
ncbi:MAG: hypothetical protein RLZZ91_1916 [Bacteroidota bacterium]